jgi:hypothetical protein
MMQHRRHNRRVTQRKSGGSVRLLRNGEPIARGHIYPHGVVVWSVAYGLAEVGHVDDWGRYVFDGYDMRAEWS